MSIWASMFGGSTGSGGGGVIENQTLVFARFVGSAVSSPATLVFNTEDKDTQNEYNNATGIFTASNDGRYIIVAHCEFDGAFNIGGDDRYLEVYKNTNTLVGSDIQYHYDENSIDPVMTVVAAIDLVENDTIEIYADSSDSAQVFGTGKTDLSITRIG